MKTKVTIDKITVSIGDKQLELTLDEAKSLHQELDNLLAKHFPVFPTPVVINQPYPVPCYPHRPIWDRWETTCGGLSSRLSGTSGALEGLSGSIT